MYKEQAARQYRVGASLIPLLPAVGQLAVLLVVATALLLPAPLTRFQVPAGKSASDLMISSWPTALLIQRTFTQLHRWPLWNPYYGGGQPLAGDPLAALFYPPTFLVPFLPLREYYILLLLGHLVFAGLGMLLLARRAAGLPRLSALVAAVSYMATPKLISHLGAGHVTIVQTVAWLPWLALACWATIHAPRRWSAMLGMSIALMLLAGHPQIAYYGLLMTATLAAWLLARRWRLEGLRALIAPVAGLAAAGVIGVLLAGIYLLPVMEFTAHSTRQLSVRSGDTYPLPNFLHALISQQPLSWIPWEGMIAPGLAVLAFALLAATACWRKVWPLALAVVLVTGLAMGNSSPLYLLVARILPDFDRFRGLARVWFVALVPIALLAGFGTESLLRALRRASPQGALAAGFAAVFVVALTLVMSDNGYARSYDARVATTPTNLAHTASQLAGSGRIYGMQENILQVSAVQLQARLADGQDPLLIESYVSYMQRAGGYSAKGYQLHIPYEAPGVQPHARLLGLMHVSVVVSDRPLNDPLFVQVGEADNTLIYKNTADAGPGYLVRPGPDGNPPSLEQLQRLDTSLSSFTQTPELYTFTFSAGTEAYFVIPTAAFPGWTANLDGHPVAVQQFAGVMPAIKIGPGTHTLSYSYAPSSVSLGGVISLIGLLAALACFIAGRRSSKNTSPHPAEQQPAADDIANARAHILQGDVNRGGVNTAVQLQMVNSKSDGSRKSMLNPPNYKNYKPLRRYGPTSLSWLLRSSVLFSERMSEVARTASENTPF